MKRVPGLVLAWTLVLAGAGCGGGDDEAGGEAETQVATAAATPPVAGIRPSISGEARDCGTSSVVVSFDGRNAVVRAPQGNAELLSVAKQTIEAAPRCKVAEEFVAGAVPPPYKRTREPVRLRCSAPGGIHLISSDVGDIAGGPPESEALVFKVHSGRAGYVVYSEEHCKPAR